MGKMKAIVAEPQSEAHLVLSDVDQPVPGPSQALVRVAAFSLNRGEVRSAFAAKERYVPGWDLAGTVEKPAADGSGPAAGTRVVGFLRSGAWAEIAAVSTDFLAELPPEVTFSQAATLPVAGLTALYVIQKGGSLLARKVLVTGASGGVGMFIVELAAFSGAKVVGLIHQAANKSLVQEAGAWQVVIGDDASGAASFGPYQFIADAVGGPVLASAFSLLAPHGLCVNYGAVITPEVTFNSPVFFRIPGARYSGFLLFNELVEETAAAGLKRLLGLVAEGHLHPHIAVEASWNQVSEISHRLIGRDFPGKAVLLVNGR
ncbi:MAG TPA: zinc-binding dehydrogenase [Anaerolineaceae bacterium]|nr:zinc-binding dehydrogenase [Anaerolineaceae bacterium]